MDKHKNKALMIKLVILNFILILVLLGFLIDYKVNKEDIFSQEELEEKVIIQQSTIYDSLVIGNPDANITIIEYIDYECPYCKKFYDTTYKQIKEKYIDTGKVKYILRDYPLLNIHKNAYNMANIVHCSNEQNKTGIVYESLLDMKKSQLYLLNQTLKDIGLNMTILNNCVQSNKYEEEILENVLQAKKENITQVPTFIIEGQVIEGAKPFKVFEKIIEEELNITSQS